MSKTGEKLLAVVFILVSIVGIASATDLRNVESITPQGTQDIFINGTLNLNSNPLLTDTTVDGVDLDNPGNAITINSNQYEVASSSIYQDELNTGNVDNRYLNRGGDSMTGNLDVNGNNINMGGGNIYGEGNFDVHGISELNDDGGNLYLQHVSSSSNIQIGADSGSVTTDFNENPVTGIGSFNGCANNEYVGGDGNCKTDNFESNTDSQDLSNNLDTSPGVGYVEHDIQISGGSDTVARDYYEANTDNQGLPDVLNNDNSANQPINMNGNIIKGAADIKGDRVIGFLTHSNRIEVDYSGSGSYPVELTTTSSDFCSGGQYIRWQEADGDLGSTTQPFGGDCSTTNLTSDPSDPTKILVWDHSEDRFYWEGGTPSQNDRQIVGEYYYDNRGRFQWLVPVDRESFPQEDDFDMGSNPIVNLQDPSNAQDAATKSYVDSNTGANTDSQDLGYNNNNAPTSNYATHEVTITGGSNTNIRDYYEANTDNQGLPSVLNNDNSANQAIDMSGNAINLKSSPNSDPPSAALKRAGYISMENQEDQYIPSTNRFTIFADHSEGLQYNDQNHNDYIIASRTWVNNNDDTADGDTDSSNELQNLGEVLNQGNAANQPIDMNNEEIRNLNAINHSGTGIDIVWQGGENDIEFQHYTNPGTDFLRIDYDNNKIVTPDADIEGSICPDGTCGKSNYETFDAGGIGTSNIYSGSGGEIDIQSQINFNSNNVKNFDFGSGSDLDASGNVVSFDNANDLDGSGNINDFSAADDLDSGGSLGYVDVDHANTRFDIDSTDVQIRLNDNSGEFRFVPYNTSSNNWLWSSRFDYQVDQNRWRFRTNTYFESGANYGGALDLNGNALTGVGSTDCASNEALLGDGSCGQAGDGYLPDDPATSNVNINGNDLTNVRRIDGNGGNHRIRFDSSSSWLEFTDQSNNRQDIVTQDVYIDDQSMWLGDDTIATIAGNNVGLGGSTSINHGDLSSVSYNDHHGVGNDITWDGSNNIALQDNIDVSSISSLTAANALVLDGGDHRITNHDGHGNFNIKAGVDDSNTIVSGSGGSHIQMSDGGDISLMADTSTSGGSSFSTDAELQVSGNVFVQSGNLDLQGNQILDIGGTPCSSSEYIGGDGNCKTDNFESNTDNQNLDNVLDNGNSAGNNNINMNDNNINNVYNITSDGSRSQPNLVLHSTSNNDNWNNQGAYVSIGESGALGSAAMHMTYRGDGYGFIGSGSVSNAIPGGSYFRFDYNSANIKTNSNIDISSPSNTGSVLDVGGGANFNGNINLNNNGGLDNVNDIEMDGNIFGAGVDIAVTEVGLIEGPNNGDTDLNIRTQGSGSHQVSIEDGSNSNADIATFNEGGVVEIPNGRLEMSNNRINNAQDIVLEDSDSDSRKWVVEENSNGKFVARSNAVEHIRITGGDTSTGGKVEIPNGLLDMNSNAIDNVGRVNLDDADFGGGKFHFREGSGTGDFQIRHSSSGNNLVLVKENGQVEIPNGNLDMNGNNITNSDTTQDICIGKYC